MERGVGKTINFVTLSIASKILGKTVLNPLYFERTQVALKFYSPAQNPLPMILKQCRQPKKCFQFRWTTSLCTPDNTLHFSFQVEGIGSMKQKKIIVIRWKCFDQIIQAIQLSRSFVKQSYGWIRMNGSHASLCIPSRSLKLLKRAVSKVFQFQKVFLFQHVLEQEKKT